MAKTRKERLFRAFMLIFLLTGVVCFTIFFIPYPITGTRQIMLFFGLFFIARAWRGLTEYLSLKLFHVLKKPSKFDIDKIFKDKNERKNGK